MKRVVVLVALEDSESWETKTLRRFVPANEPNESVEQVVERTIATVGTHYSYEE